MVNTINTSGVSTEAETIMERYSDYYLRNVAIWKQAILAMNGGREYLKKVLKKHPSETEEEYNERINSAYNINLIKYSVNEFGNYIFSKTPRRTNGTNELIEDFDLQKKHVNEVMRQIFNYHNLCGLVWVMVDMPTLQGTQIDLATKANYRVRPWCKILSPLSVVDWYFDEFGGLDWVLVEEIKTIKTNPFSDIKQVKVRTLYTKEYYQTFTVVLQDNTQKQIKIDNKNIIVGRRQVNTIKKVPIIPYSDILFNNDFNTPEIADILTIYDAVLAGESELLTNILKQTYGQLVLPMSMQSITNRILAKLSSADKDIDLASDAVAKVVTKEVNVALSRTKAIYEDAEERATARYIQPAGASTQAIIDHNDRLIALNMRMTGFLTGIQTGQRSSAESKSIDNASLSAQLVRIANKLEELEKGLWGLFQQYDSTVKIPEIDYNKDYDIHEFRAVITGIAELANINAGEAYSKQLKLTATHAMDNIHRIPDNTYAEIKKEIKEADDKNKPITFSEQAKHVSEKSGSKPDNIMAVNDYQKSTDSVGKTEPIN